MALTKKNWVKSSYTDGAWEPLVAESATLATLLVNAVGADVTGSIRLYDTVGAVELAQLATDRTFLADDGPAVLDIRSLNVVSGQELQIKFDVAGGHVVASGVV